jgi:hypothetical protein
MMEAMLASNKMSTQSTITLKPLLNPVHREVDPRLQLRRGQ